MQKYKWYMINKDGSVGGEAGAPSPNHVKMKKCPDISIYKAVDGEWVLDEEKSVKVIQETRAALYDIGLQVGALMKQANYDRLKGKELIQELDDALGHVQSVKSANPLPDTEE